MTSNTLSTTLHTNDRKWVKKTDVIHIKYSDMFDVVLKTISDIFEKTNLKGVFFGGVVRDYFTSQLIPHDIDVAVNNIETFLTELRNRLGITMFKFNCELFDDYINENSQGRKITIESVFKSIALKPIVLHIDVIPLCFLLRSQSDFDVNCLLYLSSHALGIFHLKTNDICGILQNIQNKRFRFVKNFCKMEKPFVISSFLVNFKLLQRFYKLIDDGWSCIDSLSFLNKLPFKIDKKFGIPRCSICLENIEKCHHIKCFYCENYHCLKCSFKFAKEHFKTSAGEPTCHLCRRDFFNLAKLESFDPPVFLNNKDQKNYRFFKSSVI